MREMTTLKFLKIALFLGVIVSTIACKNEPKPPTETVVTKPAEPPFVDEGDLRFIDKNGKEIAKIDIEIVDKEAERNQGMMYRTHMGEFQGMLFLFEESKPQAFWMHNTYISLDIIYVNEKKEVVSIQKNAATENDTSLPSIKPAQYVVEVNAGFSDRYGIVEGTKVQF
jgi:uncharacterized protein